MKFSEIFSIIISTFILMSSCSNGEGNIEFCSKYEIPSDVVIEIPDNQILVINSKVDFDKYFKDCTSSVKLDTKMDLAEIDFQKYTLIYIQGESTHGIAKLESSLETTDNIKKLTINIEQDLTCVMQRWNVAYLICKENLPNIKLQYHIVEPSLS